MQNPECRKCGSKDTSIVPFGKFLGGPVSLIAGSGAGPAAAAALPFLASWMMIPAGFIAGTVALAAGTEVGKFVDEHVIKIYSCNTCDAVFKYWGWRRHTACR